MGSIGEAAGDPIDPRVSESSIVYPYFLQLHDLRSPSVVAWIWAAYCKFQRTSSKEGRVDESWFMHLSIMVITIDNDSWELLASTTGSIFRFRPSSLSKDACQKMQNQLLLHFSTCFYLYNTKVAFGHWQNLTWDINRNVLAKVLNIK